VHAAADLGRIYTYTYAIRCRINGIRGLFGAVWGSVLSCVLLYTITIYLRARERYIAWETENGFLTSYDPKTGLWNRYPFRA